MITAFTGDPAHQTIIPCTDLDGEPPHVVCL